MVVRLYKLFSPSEIIALSLSRVGGLYLRLILVLGVLDNCDILALVTTMKVGFRINPTVVMNVSVFNHVRRECESFAQSLACTQCSEVADHRIDAAHGIARDVFVAVRVRPSVPARIEEVNLALP